MMCGHSRYTLMILSAKEQIQLTCGNYETSIAAGAGGRLTSLSWTWAGLAHDLIVPLRPEAFDEHDWPKAAAFPMVPSSNRLPEANFLYQSRPRNVAVVSGGNFALHGFAHRRPWNVVVTDSHARIEYTHHAGDECCRSPTLWNAWCGKCAGSRRLDLSRGGCCPSSRPRLGVRLCRSPAREAFLGANATGTR
jgi:hypothetical protein